MISDHELVLAAAATYDRASKPIFVGIDGAMKVFLSVVDGLRVAAIEGTHDPLGWALDFVALPEELRGTVSHPTLEWMHAGFYAAAVDALPTVRDIANQGPFALTGHSLGAAEAGAIGALLILEGIKPVKIGMFAPPRVAGDKYVSVVSSVPNCAYRYADDPVPMVPFSLRNFPYRQVSLTQIGRGLFAREILDPFVYHHIENYTADVPVDDGTPPPSLPVAQAQGESK